MAALVLDASVTLAALLPDEADGLAARAIVDRVTVEGAHVPALWPVEVGNGLVLRHRRGPLAFERMEALLFSLRAMPINIEQQQSTRTWDDCVRLALRHRLTLYDAEYLELALRIGLPLATFDKALRRAAQAESVALA